MSFSAGTGSIRSVRVKRVVNKDGTTGISVESPLPSSRLSVSAAADGGTSSTPKSTNTTRKIKTQKSPRAQNMFTGTNDDSDVESETDSPREGKEKARKRLSVATPSTAASTSGDDATPKIKNSPGLQSARLKPISASTSHTLSPKASSSEPSSGFESVRRRTSAASASPRPSEISLPDTASRRNRMRIGTAASSTNPNQVIDGDHDRSSISPNLKSAIDDATAGENEDEDSEYAQRFGKHTNIAISTLRGARMDDTGLDPEYNDMVRNNPLVWCDPDFAKHHVEMIWNYYTNHQRPSGKEGAKYMDVSGLTRLSNETVDRFLQRYRANLKKTNSTFTDTEVEFALTKELPHTTLGSGLSDISAIKARLLIYLKKELDKDRDLRVGRSDFMLTWKPTIDRLSVIPKMSKSVCVIL